MNREIKFRGKRVDNGEWAYGDLLTKYIYHKDLTIVESGFIYHEVDPKTVGQYTGLKDRKGKEIFEGDILEFVNPHDGEELIFYIKFDNYKWLTYYNSIDADYLTDYSGKHSMVVGNTWDNPELLEVE